MHANSIELNSISCIEDIEQLEEMLSRPTPGVIQTLGRLEGDLMILGVGGKTGPSLARMARRASQEAGNRRKIIGVSRFSTTDIQEKLERDGTQTIRCDLLDQKQVNALPDVPNIIFSAARKFGSTGGEPLTWAMNTLVPGYVADRFSDARIVAYSSGNVYPLVPTGSQGSQESDDVAPLGDYAMSVLGRERLFSYFSQLRGTQVTLVRLFYANEMRYGTLRDIGERVLSEQPIDLTMGYLNAIWQGDSNAMTLRCFDIAESPPRVINVAGVQKLNVKDVATRFGQLLGKPVHTVGEPAEDALLCDPRRGHELLGAPVVPEEKIMEWQADWLLRGGSSLDKPTHFQTRDGKF